MSELTEVLDTWYRRVWEEEDASAIDEMFVQDPEIKPIGMHKPIDLEEFKEFHKPICAQLKEIDIRIDKTVEQGDWLTALCSCYAKDTHTGEPVAISGIVMAKITDGKLMVHAISYFPIAEGRIAHAREFFADAMEPTFERGQWTERM